MCKLPHGLKQDGDRWFTVYGILLWQSEQNKAHHEIIPAVKISEQILGHQEAMICSLLLLQPRKKDPSSFPLLSTGSSHTGSFTVPRCPQSRYSGRRSRYEGLSGLIWLSVSQHCGHIPNRTQFQSQRIFMKIYLILFKLEIPSLSPVTFRQRPPSQQMLKMVKTISHVDWKVHKPLWWLTYPPGFCSPRRRGWHHCYDLKCEEVLTYVSQHWCNV